MTKALLAITALGLLAGAASPLAAAPLAATHCKDAHGKFIKCPPPKPKIAVCHDTHGKFVKCPVKPRVCHDAHGHFAKCR